MHMDSWNGNGDRRCVRHAGRAPNQKKFASWRFVSVVFSIMIIGLIVSGLEQKFEMTSMYCIFGSVVG